MHNHKINKSMNEDALKKQLGRYEHFKDNKSKSIYR